MSGNIVINEIFSDFQKHLNSDQDIRENIRTICKESDQLSREITTILQAIHYREEAIAPACLKAREMFAKAHEGFQKLKEAVPSTEYCKYHDHWRVLMQRYCYLISLTVWLEMGILATRDTVAQILGISSKEEVDSFHLDIEDYLLGVLMLCSELTRLAVNSVTRGEYNRPMQISKFVMEINAGFRLLSLKNDHLRKRYDALKYDVKKIEEIVYDLSIRGLLQQDAPPPAEAPLIPDLNQLSLEESSHEETDAGVEADRVGGDTPDMVADAKKLDPVEEH